MGILKFEGFVWGAKVHQQLGVRHPADVTAMPPHKVHRGGLASATANLTPVVEMIQGPIEHRCREEIVPASSHS